MHKAILMQQSAQPPPPPPSTSKPLSGFHGPATNFFAGIRSQLGTLERFAQPLTQSPTLGFVVALVFAAVASLGLSFVAEIPFLLLAGEDLTKVVFAPLLEEPFKALGVLVVIYFMWKTVPNRRYGAALGAAAGLGFGIAESIVYIAGSPVLGTVILRIFVTFMHPLSSAFIGIGLFAMTSGKTVPAGAKNPSGFLLPLFFLIGIANHMLWNALVVGLGIVGFLLDVFLIFPFFAIILRDVLGGHFNFQNFFEPLEKPTSTYSGIPLHRPLLHHTRSKLPSRGRS